MDEKSLSEVRSKLAGLHFSQEALTKGEREILVIAESLLRVVDLQTKRIEESETWPEQIAAYIEEIFGPARTGSYGPLTIAKAIRAKDWTEDGRLCGAFMGPLPHGISWIKKD